MAKVKLKAWYQNKGCKSQEKQQQGAEEPKQRKLWGCTKNKEFNLVHKQTRVDERKKLKEENGEQN